LSPLTRERPKALCPVGGTPLVDRAVAALAPITASVAVNAHHLADQLEVHIARVHGDGVRLSVEPELLGTGGALGALRPWIDGRAVVVVNADAVHDSPLAPLVRGWDSERIRFLLAEPAGTTFAPGVRLCGVLMPWAAVRHLPAEWCSVHERVWAPWAAGGRSVIDSTADVRGEVERSVVWDGATVYAGERLVDAIRTTKGRTVLVRWRRGGDAATTARRWTSSLPKPPANPPSWRSSSTGPAQPLRS
jgi:MurNAc alpha-1-phosphate uridylyltransferase